MLLDIHPFPRLHNQMLLGRLLGVADMLPPGDLRHSYQDFLTWCPFCGNCLLLHTKSHGILSSDTKFMGEHIQAGQLYEGRNPNRWLALKKQICWLKLPCALDDCVGHWGIQCSWRGPVSSVSAAAVCLPRTPGHLSGAEYRAPLLVLLSKVELALDLSKYPWLTFNFSISMFINHTQELSKWNVCAQKKKTLFCEDTAHSAKPY